MSGRNLDYGKIKSDSREGNMAKTTLLSMAKDMYNLYTILDDEDDLPQWCHYKLAKSSADLETVTNYLSSKISKMCMDRNYSEDDIRKYISMSIGK